MLLNNNRLYNGMVVLLFATLRVLSLKTEERPGNSLLKNYYSRSDVLCEPDHLTVYRVTLTTNWTSRSFPKHYPQWRPPAQWSKFIGMYF